MSMDPFAQLEADAMAARAAQRALRQAPEARAKRRGGRACKQRGYRFEKYLEERLSPFGFKRMPMSGALGGDHAGDLRRKGEAGHAAVCVVESKRRENESRFYRDALAQGGAHAAIVGKRGIEPLVFMELATFEALLHEAGYETRCA